MTKKYNYTKKTGRPTTYGPHILAKAEEYLQNCIDTIDEFHQTRGEKSDSYKRIVKVNLPSRVGLARYLDVMEGQVKKWEEAQPEFGAIVRKIIDEQKKRLLENGLSGDYNPVIAKLILGKHGYSEKQDVQQRITFETLDPVQQEKLNNLI